MWLALMALAAAELPAPDYREALVDAAEADADRLLAAGRTEEALVLIQQFREEVTDHPRLAYEEGLVLRLLGREREAERRLEQAVEDDPTMAAAWYDLGEIALKDGRRDEARLSFQRASELSVEHAQGWAGPFRLAEVAGLEGEPEAFERWLREALRRGFSLTMVVDEPRWRGFAAEPTLWPVIERLAALYGNQDAAEHLR